MTWQIVVTAIGRQPENEASGNRGVPVSMWTLIAGEPILVKTLNSLASQNLSIWVVLLEKDIDMWREWAGFLHVKAQPIFVSFPTQGALCTALLSLDEVNPNEPLVVTSADGILPDGELLEHIQLFDDSNYDAGALVLLSGDSDYAYCSIGLDFEILEVVEKQKISDWACAGTYLFRSAKDFFESATWVLENRADVGGNYYVSTAINYMVSRGRNTRAFSISRPLEYRRYKFESDL